ncbi:MAG: AAA family ATPase [Lachnospiraceae bacterium]|nr:AAA family ATPase [Lachnospiraceae bacterium]
MTDYIRSIDIKSFRGIKDLKLNDLMPINVLTGDNNCGKTSVLEILESFSAPDNFRIWRSLLRKDNGTSLSRGMSYYEGFYDLFNVSSEKKCLEYTIETEIETSQVVLSAWEDVEELTEEEYAKISGLSYLKEEDNCEIATLLVPKLQMEICINGESVNTYSVYDGQYRFPFLTKGYGEARNSSQKRNVIYISPIRHAEGNLFLRSVLDYPELYEQMLSILQEYDENIISINYDNDDNNVSGRGIYKILSRDHEKALPLNVYGDGMKKAVLLMSAVIKAQNGILLLDEFETAIHTSAMEKTFRWILETCMKLNVQLFLTSHSKEAIEKVLKCAPDIQEKIAVYTLYKDKEGMSVRRLTGKKAIMVQEDMGLELR